jgi:Ca2+-binding EF-hand superfamily protein
MQRQYSLVFVDKDGLDDAVEVVVPAYALRGTKIAAAERKDGWAREQEKFEKENAGKSLALNNRSSVQVAVSHVLSQMERKIQSKKAIINFFSGTDNEELDKPGFFKAMLVHGIQVTPRDVDLVFPMVDVDGSGTISIPEFVDFFLQHSELNERHKAAHLATKKQRHDRIQKKTQLQKHLNRISDHLRKAILGYLQEHHLTAEQLFERIDEDGSDSIDRMELTIALQALQINMTQRDVNIVWPLFTLNLFGNIGRKQWVRFMQGRDVSFHFTQDKYLEHLNDDVALPPVVEAQQTALAKYNRLSSAAKARHRLRRAMAAASMSAPYHKPSARKAVVAPARGRAPALVATRQNNNRSHPTHHSKNKFTPRDFETIARRPARSKQARERLTASPRARQVRLKVVERQPQDPYRAKIPRSHSPAAGAGAGAGSGRGGGAGGVGGTGRVGEVGSKSMGVFRFEIEAMCTGDQRGPNPESGEPPVSEGQQIANALAGAVAAAAAMTESERELKWQQELATIVEVQVAAKVARQAAIAAAFFSNRASSVLYFIRNQQPRTQELRKGLVRSYLRGRKRMELARPMPFPLRLGVGASTNGARPKKQNRLW